MNPPVSKWEKFTKHYVNQLTNKFDNYSIVNNNYIILNIDRMMIKCKQMINVEK